MRKFILPLITILVLSVFVASQSGVGGGGQSNIGGGGGGGAPGGTNTQLQYNNNGTFAGAPFTFSTPTGITQPGLSVNNSSGNSVFYAGPSAAGNANGFISFGNGGGGGNKYQFYGTTAIAAPATAPASADFPIDVANSTTTPTTPVGSTLLLTGVGSPVLYVAYFYSVVTTTGVGGTSFSLNFIYTDAQQAQTVAAFTNNTFTAGNVNSGAFVVQSQSGNINYSVTESGAFSTHPVLSLKLILHRL